MLKLKLGADINSLPDNIRNTIIYIQDPENNISIVSENRKKEIMDTIFEDTEDNDLFSAMKSIGIEADNPINNGVLYSAILHRETIMKLWHKSKPQVNYWLGGATYGTGDVSQEFIDNGVYAIDFGHEDILEIVSDDATLQEWIDALPEASARKAFKLFAQMKSDDVIAIKSSFQKGAESILRIKAIGTIKQDFPDGYVHSDELGHTIPVEWRPVEPNVDFSLGHYRSTIHKVTKKDDIKTVFGGEITSDSPDDDENKPTTNEISSLVLNCLGGLKNTHEILTRSKCFEINDGKRILIRVSAKLGDKADEYFYGLGKKIIDEIENIDFIVFATPNGFFKIPYEMVKELCQNGYFSLGNKVTDYKIYIKFVDGRYAFVDKSGKNPIRIDGYFTRFYYTKDDFFSEVYMPAEKYEEITALLDRKKNIILQGAPGVGKSYLAKRLAYSIIGLRDASKVAMVQFHQSYSYEDFIEGYRPDGKGGFVLKRGIFYEFCERARKGTGNYYFIIDEINRGNLSKIMGELMLLIENDKRGAEYAVPLTYSGDPFFVPENVHIIGMMNTADRSLAMIDYALRRRFSFVPIEPAFSNPDFIKYIKRDSQTLGEKILSEMVALNVDIKKDLGVGFQIGHSYFCNCDNITEQWYESVLRYEILPLLDEYWFDNEKQHSKWVKGLLPDENNPD